MPGGLLGAILLLELGLRLVAWAESLSLRRPGAGLNVLSLGESTTQGGAGDSYPKDLQALLQESCPGTRVYVKNAGLAGARSDDIRRDLPHLLREVHPQVVTIMMGINDLQGTGGPVAVVGRSRWRVVRLWNWLLASIERKAEPAPVPANADALGKLNRWDYYRLVSQPLLNENRLADLEALHRAVLQKHPESHAAKLDLGSLLRASGRAEEAFRWHSAAANELPEDPWAVWEVMLDLEALKREPELLHGADVLIRQGETLPMPIVTSLAELLERHGDPARRDRLLETAVKRAQAQAILQWLVASAREKSGKPAEAELARTRAAAAAAAPYPASLRENYQAIVRGARESGAVVVALSYPRQPIAPLAALFPDHESELVSLEEPFNEAVKKEGYSHVFYDAFGGNFGHLTKRGNELLARVLRDRLLRLDAVKADCK